MDRVSKNNVGGNRTTRGVSPAGVFWVKHQVVLQMVIPPDQLMLTNQEENEKLKHRDLGNIISNGFDQPMMETESVTLESNSSKSNELIVFQHEPSLLTTIDPVPCLPLQIIPINSNNQAQPTQKSLSPITSTGPLIHTQFLSQFP